MDEEDCFGNLVLYCIEADRATSSQNFYSRAFQIVEAALFKQRQEAKKLYNPYRNLFFGKVLRRKQENAWGMDGFFQP